MNRPRRWPLQLALGLLALAGGVLALFGNAALLRLGLVDPGWARAIEALRWGFGALGGGSWLVALCWRPAGRLGLAVPLVVLVLGLGATVGGGALVPAQFGPVPPSPGAAEREAATFGPEEWVLGVALGDEARAYPWSLIRAEFVINDTLAGRPLVIAYCISCNGSLAYLAQRDQQPLHFGVVGVYRAQTLFYDDATDSWWQEDGQAIAGPLRGAQLEQVPAALLPWSEWVTLYPHTQVALR